nr:retrovirus-related Pol polyprotein from transposon TNT 1-94 [Tanacetum cinerariifolium]
MSGALPPIPPPLGTSTSSPSSPNANRIDTMPNTDPTNTTTTNVARNVVEENNDNLPQLLDGRGGSHVTNVPTFNKDDFTSWKIRFLVFLDGIEAYLITNLEDGPFVPMSNLFTPTNPLQKLQNQWSNAESRLANQDKRLKSIIIGYLPNDVIKSVIKYKYAKEMWTELCLAYEGPSDTKDPKIAALRLNFNAFKALKVNATFVNNLPRKWLSMNQTQRSNNSIKNDSLAALYGKYHYEEDVEEDNKTNNEFMVNLNAEYHERALLANQKRFYKRSGRERVIKKIDKGLIAESFDWDDESLSSEDEKTTKFKAFMAIAEDEPSDEISDLKKVIEKWTCSKVTLDQLLSEQIPRNIVKALREKGRRKENNSKVLFTKADVSTSEPAPMIISDSEDDNDNQVPLPPLPKLTGAEPSGASKSFISLSDLTANMADLTLNTTKRIKNSSDKVSQTYVIKKKTKPKPPTVKLTCHDKNALPSTEQLIFTLMEEDYLKRSVWYLDSGCSRHITRVKQYLHRYSKESGPQVIFGDISSGDTEGYGSVNCNGITFTKVAYVNDNNACFYAKASASVNWLCHKRLSHLNFKTINNLSKYNLVSGLPSLNFSKDKNCPACEKEKHHRATFKTKRSFSINKCLHLLHMDLFGRVKPQTISHNKYTLVIVDEYSRDHLGKFDEKENDGFFLGYSPVAKAFKVFNIKRQEMEETFHTTFSEDDEAISQFSTEGDAINFNKIRSFPDDEFNEPKTSDTLSFDEVVHLKSAATFESTDLQEDDKDEPIDDQPTLHVISPLVDSVSGLPSNQFKRNKVWTLVPKPYGKTIIGLKWVFKNKMDEEGAVTKNKARLVAKGYIQEEGINYDETFVPVKSLEAIRIFLAYASYMGFTVYQIDVKSAFLNGKIS